MPIPTECSVRQSLQKQQEEKEPPIPSKKPPPVAQFFAISRLGRGARRKINPPAGPSASQILILSRYPGERRIPVGLLRAPGRRHDVTRLRLRRMLPPRYLRSIFSDRVMVAENRTKNLNGDEVNCASSCKQRTARNLIVEQ